MAAMPTLLEAAGISSVSPAFQAGDVDQCAIRGGILHPDRRRFDPRQFRRVPGHGEGRHDCHVAVDAVLVHRERRDGADGIAHLQSLHAFAQRLDNTCRFVAQASGKPRLLQIVARTVHCFGAVQAQRLHCDPDFARSRRRYVYIFDLQHLWATGLMEPYDACHESLLLKLEAIRSDDLRGNREEETPSLFGSIIMRAMSLPGDP